MGRKITFHLTLSQIETIKEALNMLADDYTTESTTCKRVRRNIDRVALAMIRDIEADTLKRNKNVTH